MQPVGGRTMRTALQRRCPILALDMYEHAYHLDFGANAAAYVDQTWQI
jgi:superoxide dismutase